MSNPNGNPDLAEAGNAENQRRAQASQTKITDAIQRLHHDGHPITVTGVAKEAGVNVSTIRRHPDLLQQVIDLRKDNTTARTKAAPRTRHNAADYDQIKSKYLAAQARIKEMEARISELEATADRALLGAAAAPKADALKQAQDRAADLAVQLTNTNAEIHTRNQRIEELEDDIAAQAEVNRDLFTELNAAQDKSQRLRQKITRLNLRLGANSDNES